MDYENIIAEQKKLCDKYKLPWVESPAHLKVGIAENVKSGILPINGLRHPIENGTTGWYMKTRFFSRTTTLSCASFASWGSSTVPVFRWRRSPSKQV